MGAAGQERVLVVACAVYQCGHPSENGLVIRRGDVRKTCKALRLRIEVLRYVNVVRAEREHRRINPIQDDFARHRQCVGTTGLDFGVVTREERQIFRSRKTQDKRKRRGDGGVPILVVGPPHQIAEAEVLRGFIQYADALAGERPVIDDSIEPIPAPILDRGVGRAPGGYLPGRARILRRDDESFRDGVECQCVRFPHGQRRCVQGSPDRVPLWVRAKVNARVLNQYHGATWQKRK